MDLYRLLRPLLFSLDAETAHSLVVGIGGRLPRLVRDRSRQAQGLIDTVAGIHFQGPIGLAAGADKGGHALELWQRLGFGAIEIGTVTPRPQRGNDRPRVHRLVGDRAVINRMGFPSEGMQVVWDRLTDQWEKGKKPGVPVGINVGKNKNTTDEDAARDYADVAAYFKNLADYITVNVSSPNTPGLRGLQKAEPLRRIIDLVLLAVPDLPVLVKISPDMSSEDLVAAVEAVEAAGASGIIATNTTLARPVPSELMGGLSGAPLYPASRDTIRMVLGSTSLPVIGVGGIDSPEKAIELLRMGCAALQLYTGLVYEGPGLVERINRGILDVPGGVGL